MDRNENGMPRVGNATSAVKRDCTGKLVGSDTSGGCGPNGGNGICADCLDTKPLAYCYTPIQRWQLLYTLDEALGRGTLFEELDKPLGVYGNE